MTARPDGTTMDEWDEIVHTWWCDEHEEGGASREPEAVQEEIEEHNRRLHERTARQIKPRT